MSGKDYEYQRHIRLWIGLYLDEHGMTSLQQIVDYVAEKANITISRSTVARLVRRMGYEMKKGEWVKR